MFKSRQTHGFSALELIIVISILVILVGVTIWPLVSLRRHQLLSGSTEQVISLLTEARSRTLSALSGTNYGVSLATNQLVLFQGASYPGTTLETLELNTGVSLTGINLSGGGSVIIFNKLTGKSDQSGTLVLSLDSDTSQTKTIKLETTGVVYLLP